MSLRTVTVPVNPGADMPSFPAHDVADVLDYTLACGPWLADAGLTLASAAALRSADAALTVMPASVSGTDITVRVAGGTVGADVVGFDLTLSNASTVRFVVPIPIVDRGAGLVRVGSPLTVASVAITIGGSPVLVS